MMLTKRLMPALSSDARSSAVWTCTVFDANGCRRSHEFVRADAVGRCDRDDVDLALLVQEPLSHGQVEDGHGRSAERADLAEATEADDLEGRGGRQCGNLDDVTDPHAVAVGGARVEHDLAVACGPASLAETERVELLVLGLEAHHERGVAGDLLPARADHDRRWRVAGEVEDRSRRPLDAGNCPYLLQRRGRQRGCARLGPVHDRLPRDDDVGLCIRAREDDVERALHRRTEDGAAGHHRDAEDDRERGQCGAQLAGAETSQRYSSHRAAPFRAAATSSIADWSISPTMWPSAR